MALRSGFSALLMLCSRALAVSPNPVSTPYVIGFEADSIGPDGPWWYMKRGVDAPNQNVSLVPSVSQTTLVINASACSAQGNSCPLPVPTMWTASNWYTDKGGNETQSELFDVTEWDADYAALLRLDGQGRYFRDRMTIYQNNTNEGGDWIVDHGMGISQNYTVGFPGGAAYTKDTGFFSLYGSGGHVKWTGVNGSKQTPLRTLLQAYQYGYIPSKAYGLHLGSVNPPVAASLTLGGYDSSRCLTDPISSDTDYVQLLDISLNVSSGGSAYLDASSGPLTGLLRANGSSASGSPVFPRPGVPYMYLPRETCDAIAAHLPVTYNEDFNLYFWDTDDRAYDRILSSPHYMAFTFATESGQNSSINVPLAVLNLTLESPLTSTPTKYFPCSPWVPADTGYTLGSAFLQSVFLAQNWQTDKLYLAQAPGPDYLSPMIKKIGNDDTTLAPATNPPDWESTWSSILKPLSSNQQPNSGSRSTDGSSSSISGGAIAGIVVGVIVALALAGALAIFLIRRRREAARQRSIVHPADKPGSLPPGYASPMPGRKSPQPAVQAEAKPPTAEMDSSHEIQELAGSEPERGHHREVRAVGPPAV